MVTVLYEAWSVAVSFWETIFGCLPLFDAYLVNIFLVYLVTRRSSN